MLSSPSPLLLLPVGGYALLMLGWRVLRGVSQRKEVSLPELALFTKTRPPQEKIPGTAVICGGSIAGLLAARVCHDHFERVIVVETEEWLFSDEGKDMNTAKQRNRLVQSVSLHVWQSFVVDAFERLFPRLVPECEKCDIPIRPFKPLYRIGGVPLLLPPAAFFGGTLPLTFDTSRAGFETMLRRLVMDHDMYPNIEFVSGTATDVIPDPSNPTRLSKVVVRMAADGALKEFDAALVADCTGPTRAGLKWLSRAGYGIPSSIKGKLPLDELKIVVDQQLHYSSLTFTIPETVYSQLPIPAEYREQSLPFVFMEGQTPTTLAKGNAIFILLRVHEQLILFTGHYGDQRAQAKTLAEAREYVHDLEAVQPIPGWVFETLDRLESLELEPTASVFRVNPTSYIRYHLAGNLPSNYVALGDSVMNVNPVYAEGTSKATRCALALQKTLLQVRGRLLPPDFGSTFFHEEHEKTGWTWEGTRLNDYGHPQTQPLPGESLSSGAPVRWYFQRFLRLAASDKDAAWAIYNIQTGLGSPIDALHPHIVAKVLWRALVGV